MYDAAGELISPLSVWKSAWTSSPGLNESAWRFEKSQLVTNRRMKTVHLAALVQFYHSGVTKPAKVINEVKADPT